MQTKLFEIRDEGTFIPVMATKMNPLRPEDCRNPQEQAERYLLRRAGYGYVRPAVASPPSDTYVKVSRLDKGYSTYNIGDWAGQSPGRTMLEAHKYIIEHWAELASGDVIDVQYILGETSRPRKSEAVEFATY